MLPEPNESLAREYRIQETGEFRNVMRSAVLKRTSLFVFRSKSNHKGTARLGFAVPSRLIKAATRRNHIKRLIRESFRKQRAQLPLRDYLIIYAGSAKPSGEKARAELHAFWSAEVSKRGADG